MEQQDRTLNEQQATIAQLKKELQTTTARQQKQIEALLRSTEGEHTA